MEEYGYVTSYAPRVSSGDHQHLLFVRGESEIEVPLPVAPQIQQGEITVDIDLSTQVKQIPLNHIYLKCNFRYTISIFSGANLFPLFKYRSCLLPTKFPLTFYPKEA